MNHQVKTKRAYDPPAKGDGYRVLVDRLWPRGLKKSEAHVDEWLKDVAPSEGLRKAFGHDPDRWPSFQKAYASELRAKGTPAREALGKLVRLARTQEVTLVYAAKDEEHNNALVLQREMARADPAPSVSPSARRRAATARPPARRAKRTRPAKAPARRPAASSPRRKAPNRPPRPAR